MKSLWSMLGILLMCSSLSIMAILSSMLIASWPSETLFGPNSVIFLVVMNVVGSALFWKNMS